MSMFDGETFVQALDEKRLKTLMGRVTAYMSRGIWSTLREIQEHCGGSEASVSARLRDLRKAKFGAFTVERRRRGDPKAGIHEYRLKL